MNATLKFAIEIAREAGVLLRDGQEQVKKIERKSSAIDLVTQYDEAAEKLLVGHISTHFPNHRIVAEEGSNKDSASPFVWYVDPLDGTNNFAHGLPVYCISLALYENETPRLAVVYDPSRGECFSAENGKGAHLHAQGKTRHLHVSDTPDLLNSLVGTGFPYDRHTSEWDNLAEFGRFLKQTQGMRRAGAAALDLANVAAGRLDGFWEYKLNSWDVAAGILLITEAGGRVSDTMGAHLTMHPDRLNIVASNGKIHSAMLSTIANPTQL